MLTWVIGAVAVGVSFWLGRKLKVAVLQHHVNTSWYLGYQRGWNDAANANQTDRLRWN